MNWLPSSVTGVLLRGGGTLGRAYTEERPQKNIGRKQNLQVKEFSGLGRNQCAYLDFDLLSFTQKGESRLLLLTYLVCDGNSSKHKSQ